MPFNMVIRSQDDEELKLYTPRTAARLAGVSISFWRTCEQEGLVRAHRMSGGGKGYNPEDIEQMAVIRRLHEDLELDMPSLEVILHMRRRIIKLLDEMEELERLAQQREQKLLAQMRELRRELAKDAY
jgi:DNA-binding transcriptional MerR regulator